MCEMDGVTREHVPPRNLFPELRDVGKDFRRDLITVPSCELHNSAKSQDDEFLMVSLAGIVGNNSIGYLHGLTKVDRALRRTAHRLLDKVLVKKRDVRTLELDGNKFCDVIWGTPDVARLHRCFDHIGRGLHYHHFGTRFVGKTQILLGYLFHDDQSSRNWVQFVRDRAELDLADKPKLGANPGVFYYQVTDHDIHGLFLIKLCFYGGLNVYIAFIGAKAEVPTNLGMELMKRGVKTIFRIGEKTYEIN
jgi:hypothetical protein